MAVYFLVMLMKTVLAVTLLFFTSLGTANSLCHQVDTTIAQVQGSGAVSPLLDQKVTIEGIVTGDFQGQNGLQGFFIQSIKADDDSSTSEALFVHHSKTDVAVGEHWVLEGVVSERHELTQINQVKSAIRCQNDLPLPEATSLTLPLESQDLESLEGMLLVLPQTLTVTDVYRLVQYGQLTVSYGRVFGPTQIALPGQATQHVKAQNALNQLIIDDGQNGRYLPQTIRTQQKTADLSAQHPVRLGYQVTGVTGVLDYGFDQWRLQPTQPVVFDAQANPRQEKANDVDGEFQLATFNVENLFRTIDHGKDVCGPNKNWGCRGADSISEWQRQLDKVVAAITQSGAELVAIQELENDQDASVKALVKSLNGQSGAQWAYVDTGALGDDVLKNGIIYQSDVVKPIGQHKILDDRAMPAFKVHRHRPVVLQGFETPSGFRFQLASIHMKSKSCREAEGKNKAQGDGQGCYAGERTLAAKQLIKWVSEDPLGLAIEATFLAGDFNSYGREDAIRVYEAGGYTDVIRHLEGDHNWTASYRGQVGALDHIFANEAAMKHFTGASQWHINADEFHGFGYDEEDWDQGHPKPASFYRKDPFASSDHDMVLVGIKE